MPSAPNKVVCRDGSKCIRVFNTAFSKADILNEALNQARIEETGLNIPKTLGVTVVEANGPLSRNTLRARPWLSKSTEPEHKFLLSWVDVVDYQ